MQLFTHFFYILKIFYITLYVMFMQIQHVPFVNTMAGHLPLQKINVVLVNQTKTKTN